MLLQPTPLHTLADWRRYTRGGETFAIDELTELTAFDDGVLVWRGVGEGNGEPLAFRQTVRRCGDALPIHKYTRTASYFRNALRLVRQR